MNFDYQFLFRRYLAHTDEKSQVAKHIFKHLNKIKKQPLRILDVGCGTGEISLKLAQRGHQVVAIDQQCQWPSITPPNITFQQINAFDFETKCPFDVIIISYVLWEIDASQWDQFLEHLSRFLKKEGRLLVIDSLNERDYDNPFFDFDISLNPPQKTKEKDWDLYLKKRNHPYQRYPFDAHIWANNPTELYEVLEFFFANGKASEFYHENRNRLVEALSKKTQEKEKFVIKMKHAIDALPAFHSSF